MIELTHAELRALLRKAYDLGFASSHEQPTEHDEEREDALRTILAEAGLGNSFPGA